MRISTRNVASAVAAAARRAGLDVEVDRSWWSEDGRGRGRSYYVYAGRETIRVSGHLVSSQGVAKVSLIVVDGGMICLFSYDRLVSSFTDAREAAREAVDHVIADLRKRCVRFDLEPAARLLEDAGL